MRPRYRLLLASALFVLFFYLVIYEKCFKTALNSYKVLDDHNLARARFLEENKALIERPRYILLYTNFFKESHWGLPAETLGPDYFQMKHCPVTNCVLTSYHELITPITEYDALVFHVATPWDGPLPDIRGTRQVYVAAIMESPAHTKHMLALDDNFFNWTMTYRLDSDVLFNYQNIIDLESGEVVSPALQPIWRNGFSSYANDTLLDVVSKKRKMAAQFVSHCGSLSRRDELVRKLQSTGLDVDVYGSCGTLKCIRGNPECNQMLDSVYWFYLSFENSLCVDYVTEKLYNALEHYVVPIVFGGADYRRFVPPGSYIDVQNYTSVEELVDYLLYLMDNPHEYVKYFWWKDQYAVDSSNNAFCELCSRLHSVSTRQKVQYYRDIKSWWYDDACSVEPRIRF
ncbi:alpha-(1,3)-fucosyltransferase C [Anopheles bellator]|uniref:alpha-(1,3)-fucosyltransferase C n=1 Tax=Anopheles bellator TaxID=139047 RepID=UPI002648082E|nr:alpha-(1,3)-fucosyltransferase C [Anopheles bellator]